MAEAKTRRTRNRLPRTDRGEVDLLAVDHDLAALLAPRRRRAREVAIERSPPEAPASAGRAGEHGLAEPGPMSIVPPLTLASLPPPMEVYTPPSSLESFVRDLAGQDGLREPSISPPALPEAAEDPALALPRLSLAPLPVEPPREDEGNVKVVPAAMPSLAPEALELDLSVLGPSEDPLPPSEHSGVRSGIIEEIDAEAVEELDAMELDDVGGAHEGGSRGAPPLLPPRLRSAR
ncbi:MAG: hypothetical protein R3A48_18765 [Polyangiales bacterium]